MGKPTEDAEQWFREARRVAKESSRLRATVPATVENNQRSDMALATAIDYLCHGMSNLSVGLRATYQLLDSIKNPGKSPSANGHRMSQRDLRSMLE